MGVTPPTFGVPTRPCHRGDFGGHFPHGLQVAVQPLALVEPEFLALD